MRENTAKLGPAPSALHLMASGVVDQIAITDRNEAGSDIVSSRLDGLKNKKGHSGSLWPFSETGTFVA
jgi:hypothetical protein